MFRGLAAIFMHDPISLPSVRSSTLVENQGLPHPYNLVLREHGFVPSRGLPEPRCGGPVGSGSGRVFLVLVTEEVPFVLFLVP